MFEGGVAVLQVSVLATMEVNYITIEYGSFSCDLDSDVLYMFWLLF